MRCSHKRDVVGSPAPDELDNGRDSRVAGEVE
jgi:hypothetical protein